ncbi:PA3496 family putative envelope integrity protein [Legionella londiniensis]|uniref:Uncharacterized protein n=1 Tax=Legionella londiniensis TaxID=45068 RepID=A0A0W0VLU8_9GAMM|nr:hypothetical protein [Legionella londiniensis]KTD21076.1 hypothetical protein Llon_1174 [Legionella londiniensis]STX93652.1 Uncharacterised protein [Legionella londiniensis]
MSELFDDEEEKDLIAEDEFVDPEEILIENTQSSFSDARRRLENLLEEKRLKDEIEDFFDY